MEVVLATIRDFIKGNKTLTMKFAWVSLGIFILSLGLSFLLEPDLMKFLNWADNKGIALKKTQIEKFINFIINNGLKVPFQMFLLSLIPIPFMYYLPIALTAAATGVVFYLPFSPQLEGQMSLFQVFLSIFTHGIFEFFSLFIILAVLYRFNKAIRSRLFKKVNSEMGVVHAFKKAAAVYCFIALPLLVLAAFIESFITPMITS